MTLSLYAERIQVFFRYYLKSTTRFQIHSPLLSDLINIVFDSDRLYYDFMMMDQCWRSIMDDSSEIPASEFGELHRQNNKRVNQFAQRAISKPSHYEMLYRLADYLKPQQSLELGSALGLSSMALALGKRDHSVTTVEGNSFFANYCKHVVETYKLQNIHVYNLPFSEFLKSSDLRIYDLFFLDGDHTYSSTLSYAKKILESSNAHAVLVLDDIHWSKDMYRAWTEIIHWPEIQCSLETPRLGFLFKSPDISKGRYSYIPFWCKPWKIGLSG